MSSDKEIILIVDDVPANLDLLTQTLEPRGYRILAAPDAESALSIAARAKPDMVLLDIVLPDSDGYETCRRLHALPELLETPVIFISARTEIGSLVEAFRAGGIDYLAKPIDPDEVVIRVETHLRASRLARQLREKNIELTTVIGQLREEIGKRQQAETALKAADDQLSSISQQEAERWGLSSFVGNSKTLKKILHDVHRLQNFSSVNVLITGESGTGKELVARAMHFGSTRSAGPFIPVNCVAIPSELAESMFFGHTRGAFTGATMDRKGYFELADGGTLFLDEIGDMPAILQAKLLRVLEDGCITPVGSCARKKLTSASSPPPTRIWTRSWNRENFAVIYIFGSRSFRSFCRRCATARKIFHCSRGTFCNCSPPKWESRQPPSIPMRCRCFRDIHFPAMCAS